jgi:hypothetical protein
MGRYVHKYVSLPEGMVVGSEVYCIGEGDEVLTIDTIEFSTITKMANRIALSHGCWEPICKIFLKKGSFEESRNNEGNWAFVAVGECDKCKTTFPDSCAYNREDNNLDSMICNTCWKKKKEVS